MDGELHRLLNRQLRRFKGGADRAPEDWAGFLAAVSAAYDEADGERRMLERSLDLSSRELMHANTEMRAVFLACPDVFVWLDNEGCIQNAHAQDHDPVYGSVSSAIGTPIADICQEIGDAFEIVCASGEQQFVEYDRDDDGGTRSFEARLLPLSSKQTIIIIRDITTRREAERLVSMQTEQLEARVLQRTADLLQAKSEAEAANAAKSEFLANMSHELRTPLHGILGYAGLGLEKSKKAEERIANPFFDRIVDNGKTLLTLLNNLLDLARLESGKMQASMQRVNLASIVDDVADEFRSVFAAKDLHVDFDPGAAFLACEADAGMLKQVFRNLIANAGRFTSAGGTIRIETEADEELSRVRVLDEGVGIPEGETEAIFEKFVQSTRTRSGAGGTGLGLAICKDLIEVHQGRIWAENRPDKGACFTVELPSSQTAAPAPAC